MSDQHIAEPVETFIWIRQTLLNDPVLSARVNGQVYGGVAPNSATYPFITMQVLDTFDRLGVGAWILWSDQLILVRATTNKNSAYSIRDIAALIQYRLHGQSGTTEDAEIISSVRERPHAPPPEETDGIFYSHVGGEYRIKTRPIRAI